jgi:hypothetical protein
MGRNDIDNDAPASDAVLALDASGARRDDPPPVVGADEPRPASGRKPSLRVVPRRRARIGRPPRLTPALQEQLVAAVRRTGWLGPAARACGIPENVVAEWVARGRGTHPTRPATREYAEFAHAIKRAQGEWETAMLARISAAADVRPEHWTAAAWSLERFDPEHYGRRNRVDVGGTITIPEVRGLLIAMIDVLERYIPDPGRREAEFANLLAEARELGGGSVVALPPPHES